MKNILRQQKGFTLIEVMIVSAILSVVLIAVYSVTAYSQAIFQDGHSYQRLTHASTQTLRSLSREIGQTSPNGVEHLSITADGNANSVVVFQIPVDWDNDGDAITGNLSPIVEWGAYNSPGEMQDGRLGDWIAYYVDANTTQLIRELRDGIAGAAYAGTQQVICNNALNFAAVQNGKSLNMTLTVQLTDTVGNLGQQKIHTQTFTSQTLLRNAVD